MQTALHIHALVREIDQTIVGGRVVDTEFYKKERAAWIYVKKDKPVLALGLVYHPAGSGCVLIPGRKARPDTREKPWPIFQLTDAVITGVSQPTLDRIFFFECKLKSGDTARLVVEAIGPNGNLWWLNGEGEIQGTLRKKDFSPRQKYQPMALPSGQIDPFDFNDDDLRSLIQSRAEEGGSLLPTLHKGIMGFSRTIAIETVKRADLDFAELDAITDEDITALAETIRDIASRFANAEVGYLYHIGSGYEAYPFKLSSKQDQPEKLKSLSLAMLETINRRQNAKEEADDQKKILDAVTRAVNRISKRIGNLELDIEKAADYERHKRIGDVLQIHRNDIKKGMTEIRLPDAFAPDGDELAIKLDPALSTQENIEEYFKKHRKGREGLATLERRLEISKAELEELRSMRNQLELNFDSAVNRYASEIANLLPQSTAKRESAPRLPYRPHTLSSGVTIFIGKDGADNDRTTFEFARPYELWFHTQQCPGSHVVLKFPNKNFEPSKQEIAETAAIAAWHSKARNDSLVPVIYTERRYVRKPRKAKPGLVTVEREKSLMVQPTKPVDHSS